MSEPQKTARYRRPGSFTRRFFNPAVAGLTRLGLSVMGSNVLEVRGRRSGLVRSTPVNVLEYDGCEYVVAARGETEWVRNLRAAGGRATLVRGRKRRAVLASEVRDQDRSAILRPYLKRWKFEVGVFFGGVRPDSPEEEFSSIAPLHPVFVLRDPEPEPEPSGAA